MWSPRLKNVESKIAFGQSTLRKLIKTVATRCQILMLRERSPDPLAGFKWAYF